MKVLIMYYSRSGNTKHLAESIKKGVLKHQNITCDMKPAKEVTKNDFLTSQAIIAGSPVYFGTMAAELKKVFDDYVGIRKKMGDKIGAAFATGADESGGKETTILSIIQAMLIYGMIIVGDPLEATGHYGIASTGTPTKTIEEHAQKLGYRVAALTQKIHD